MQRSSRPLVWLKWASWALIAICLVAIVSAIPVDTAVERLKSAVDGLGALGQLVFGGAYVVAALLFVPGSALTLAAGALFGLLWGTVIVSFAATTAAALAFLIARYLARDKVAGRAARSPRFAAIDRAIGDGGWRIIALLRLSPAIPFSLGNYLFGLTGIRFVPYVLASWVFMLPGTFMYVYFGYAAATATTSIDEGQGRLVLTVVGLAATVAVTLYVTRLARRAIRERTGIAPQDGDRESAPRPARTSPRVVWTSVAIAVLCTGLAANRSRIPALFGPPAAEMAEAYREQGTATFDHAAFDGVLRKRVDAEGRVDYAGLAQDTSDLDRYIASLASAPFADLGRDEKLALLINAYNAFTLRLIVDHLPLKSIRDIPEAERWKAERWKLAGRTFSLDQIEHQEIRARFREPRIHFALVCAAIGCPKLRIEAYTGARLEEQLEDQTRYTHRHDRWFRFDAETGTVHLTRLYDWFRADFLTVEDSVLDFAARYSPDLQEALAAGARPEIEWLEYDWTLNRQAPR